MILALVLVSIALASKPSVGYPVSGYDPLGYDFALDYDYYPPGPWSTDYLRGARWWGGRGGLLPYDDGWDLDYASYPMGYRAVDGGRERMVTDDKYTWTRDRTVYPAESRGRYGPSYLWPTRRFGGLPYGPRIGGFAYGPGIGDFAYGPRAPVMRADRDLQFLRR